jgi:hypothetical protein
VTTFDSSPAEDEPQLFASFSAESPQQRQAKEALKKLHEAFSGTPVADTIERVLAGEKSMSDLMRDPQMAAVMRQTAAQIQTEISDMSPEELETMKKERGL